VEGYGQLEMAGIHRKRQEQIGIDRNKQLYTTTAEIQTLREILGYRIQCHHGLKQRKVYGNFRN